MKTYYAYLMTNKNNNVIYTGTTSNLIKRVYEHKNKLADGFTKKYNIDKLVYFEQYPDPISAITREKQIKAGSRQKKIDLIKKNNPDFKDLFENILQIATRVLNRGENFKKNETSYICHHMISRAMRSVILLHARSERRAALHQ